MNIKAKLNSFTLAICCSVLLGAASFGFWFLVLKAQTPPLLQALQVRQNFITLTHQVDKVLKRPQLPYFEALQKTRDQYDPALAADVFRFNQSDLALQQNFTQILGQILSQQPMLLALPKIHQNLGIELHSVIELFEAFSDKLSVSGAYSVETIREIDGIVAKLQTIATQVAYLSDMNHTDNVFAIAALSEALQAIDASFNQLEEGNAVAGIQSFKGRADEEVIFEAKSIYGNIALAVTELLAASPELIDTKQSAARLPEISLALLNQFDLHIQTQSVQETKSRDNIVFASILLVLILLMIVILLFAFYDALKHKTVALEYVAYSEQEKNQKHEAALLRIMQELASLSEGDLSTQLTVTDDSTGVICDAFNMTIEGLRDIVLCILENALKVDEDIQALTNAQSKGDSITQNLSVHLKNVSQNTALMVSLFTKMHMDFKNTRANRTSVTEATRTQEADAAMKLNHALENILQVLHQSVAQLETSWQLLLPYCESQQHVNALTRHKVHLLQAIKQFRLPTDVGLSASKKS